MINRKRHKAKQNLFRKICRLCSVIFKWLIKRFLRSLLVIGKRVSFSKSGFVMPTVAMVTLVVILLTTVIALRSFDRSKNATNVRVNQAVINAATPALDRARAKIDALFADPTLPRATPSDQALYKTFTTNRYTLGDETRLKLVQDFNNQSGIQSNTNEIEDDETLTSAWKFPVDTDNNGRFDSYTLYGIYFRSPSRDADGKFKRARNSLEARTPPMSEGQLGGRCAAALATSSSIVGDSDWYKSGNKLTKSFFVYTANLPITDLTNIPVAQRSQYEQYQGSQGFSALELQQDRIRIPLNNHAAWYEDDLEVSNATTVRLNGRVFTNSNLMVAGNDSSNKVIFYQVSDPDSCYYNQENSKITVGGNVANADVRYDTDNGNVEVHRFQGKGTNPAAQNTTDGISSTNKTTTQTGGKWVGYNNQAYSQRIGLMVQAALNLHSTTDPTNTSVEGIARYPQQVKERFKQRFNDHNETKQPRIILTEELEAYFRERTRRVPYAEVPGSSGSGTALGSYTVANVLGSTSPIRPPDAWMTIETTTGTTTTSLPLSFGSNTMNLKATEPTKQQKDGKENFIGDRISVGNNLPFFPPKYTTTGTFDKFADQQEPQPVKNGSSIIYWNDPENSGNATNTQRTRQSQVEFLPDLGSVDRDGYWETVAGKQPASNENTGGLRVITGSGIYIDGVATAVSASGGTGVRGTNSFLPAPALNSGTTNPDKFTTATITTGNDNIIVWSDSMPLWDGSSKKGDLQMRATGVYHYKQGSAATLGSSQIDPNQVPIACVSSYFDPTDSTTARNLSGLPDVSATYDTDGDGTRDKLADDSAPSPAIGANNGRSNNGVTYNAPYTSDAGRTAAVSTYRDKLNRQARMIFPTGRIVNQSLRKALANIDASKPRSLADNAALDTAICALKIVDGTIGAPYPIVIPHGAIKEAAFLDGRQIKSLNNLGSDNTKIAETKADLTDRYTLPLEQRQPLEIRVTELDLNLLRNKEIGTATDSSNSSTNNQEYLLPNSGIIYATRDDALADESDSSTDATTRKLVSPSDFKLDSTRRPNGIRLINGSNLARKDFFRVAEKGLILATNLPTYIKGDFNLHKGPGSSTVREEFEATLNQSDWNNFYTRDNTLNTNFACRQNQQGCSGSGDQWRPVTIISDAQILLSKNFWDGFRNQGDYDLNNNRGNSAADARRKQGFWNNNFVTSANWVDSSNNYPRYQNSYLTNGVTPIHRRVNDFPEYIMEICRKLSVSECQPNDWVIGYDINNDGDLEDTILGLAEKSVNARNLGSALASVGGALIPTRLGAGTTAKPALVTADLRYPRRVAFARNQIGTLVFTQIGSKFTAKPLGVGCIITVDPNTTGCTYPNGIDAKVALNYPTPANNALWFRTTNNKSGDPGSSSDITYAANRPLYYLPPDLGGEKLILPDTPEISGVTSLNGSSKSSTNDPSDFTMCIKTDGQSQDYLVSSLTKASCPDVGSQLDQLLGLTPSMGTLTGKTQVLDTSTTSNINIYKLSDIENGATITLNGNSDSIFIFQGDSAVKFGAAKGGAGIKIVLKGGVNPNNIFWVLKASFDINDATAIDPHQFVGNFIGKAALKIGENTQVLGGRFLGFSNLVKTIPLTTKVYAVASDGQPSLVPVLQIHSPTGTPGGTTFNGLLTDKWMQAATSTTANAAFVAGDSPSKPDRAENGGGLHNFVRFIENWSGQTATIAGSFIQYKRSSYATGPQNPVDPTVTDASASLFYTLNGSNQTPYRINSETGFRYRVGTDLIRAAHYWPPNLSFGFDVAILSQLPDLFAQRFTLNPSSRPNEYFREVGRDDDWIKTLLCAAQASDRKGGSGATFTTSAISTRPSDCPVNLPYPANP